MFCQILLGEIPGTFVHRDGLVRPSWMSSPSILGTFCSCRLGMLPTSTRSTPLLRERSRKSDSGSRPRCAAAVFEGVNLFLADGEAVGQEVSHVHLHVFPRFKGVDLGFASVRRTRSVRPVRLSRPRQPRFV